MVKLIPVKDLEKYYCGITVDTVFRVKDDEKDLALVYVNTYYPEEATRDPDGTVHCPEGTAPYPFIEWAEIAAAYRGKGYIKKIIEAVRIYYDSDFVRFTANDEIAPMYEHLGAIKIGYDPDAEQTMFEFRKNVAKKN